MRHLFLIILLSLSTPSLAVPRVLASIAPVYEIAAAIMQGVGEPRLLIDGNQSAHHFSFKPSHLRLVQQAQLLIWVDRNFEEGLQRIPEMIPPGYRHIELLRQIGIDSSDGHFWYSSELLQRSIERITEALQEIDKDNAQAYRRNADRLINELKTWHVQLPANRQNPFLVTDHEFLGHFETYSGIGVLASIYNHFDDHAGIKNLNELESKLQQYRPRCLLSLDRAVSKLANNLAEKYQLEIIYLSSADNNHGDSPAIIQRLQRLSDAIKRCR
ncbi:MAG: zinc transport system substrate-binding protein [Gammaproteobacteria bacterium]|jgi:zinc transport system substrate-binding protein